MADISGVNERHLQAHQSERSGADVSAVGICSQLLKNEGLLRMSFEGQDGDSAEWSFHGLDLGAGKPLHASASTQTHADPNKCSTCGRDTATTKQMQDFDTQTDVTVSKIVAIQTSVVQTAEVSFMTEASVQSEVEPESVNSQVQNISMQNRTSIKPSTLNSTYIQSIAANSPSQHLKRETPPEPHAATPVHKRAKSKHNSLHWPQRSHMVCWREKPITKGDLAKLIIDIEKATVSYEKKCGKDYAPIREIKQIDLRAPDNKCHPVSMPELTY